MAILLIATILFFILIMVGAFAMGLSMAQQRDAHPALQHLTRA